MKKIIIMALLASACIAVQAQKKEKSEKQAEYMTAIADCVRSANFTFTAMSMKPSLGKLVPIQVSERTIDIVQGHIMVLLPYDDAPTTAYDIPEFLRVDEPDFDADYVETDKNITLKVVVSGMSKTPLNPNSRIVFVFNVKKSNGSASVEVTPDVSHPITYYGTVLPK